MNVLLVDNYDSFTHNLAQLVAEHTGRLPRVVRNDAASVDDLIAWEPDAVILSPGPGSPATPGDVGVGPELVARLEATPVLGVCLGHQVIGVTLGARVVHAPEPMHGRRSTVRHTGAGLFAGLSPSLEVVRYHSLVVDRASLPPSLELTAWSEDGLVMGIAHRSRPLHGVQFHPESILTDGGRALIANFLALAAGARRAERKERASGPKAIDCDGRASGPRGPCARERTRTLPWVDPESAFLALLRDEPLAFWLDGTGRFSYMGRGGDETLRSTSRRIERITPDGAEQIEGDPFAVLGRLLEERALPTGEGPEFGLSSGFVGYLGYELKEFCDGGQGPRGEAALPDLMLMRADRTLVFDHARREVILCGRLEAGQPDELAERWLDETTARLREVPPPPPVAPPMRGDPIDFHPDRGPVHYLEDVARIMRQLVDGEAYEVCLTTQVRARVAVDPLDLHRVLRRSNPARYSAFLRFPEAAIVCASPERFVHVAADGLVESRPIKGTRRRGDSAADDVRARAQLAASEKDRAENLMIVDLVRNDLGRVCTPGSVEVPELMAVEAHPTVFHMVSTVRGRLADGVAPLEAVRALFPGGSMTGAPKIRAMRIIGELEGAPRGVYSGGIGFLSFRGVVDLAMAIRTVVVRGDEVSFGVGGAVVALSDPEAELDEAQAKGAALRRAIAQATGRPPSDG